jgi:hypothetical protein
MPRYNIISRFGGDRCGCIRHVLRGTREKKCLENVEKRMWRRGKELSGENEVEKGFPHCFTLFTNSIGCALTCVSQCSIRAVKESTYPGLFISSICLGSCRLFMDYSNFFQCDALALAAFSGSLFKISAASSADPSPPRHSGANPNC